MQPNVIMILIDDLGWMDLSCQGSSFYETPHIDQLRREGMAFDQAYAACPVCSPSRASILSGKYPGSPTGTVKRIIDIAGDGETGFGQSRMNRRGVDSSDSR